MKREHRRWHPRLWIVLGPLTIVVFALAMWLRDPYPHGPAGAGPSIPPTGEAP